MKIVMKVIRWIVGRLILLVNALTMPQSIQRSAEEQAVLDQATKGMSLYQFEACPFCVKVRRAIKRLNLNISLKNAKSDCQAQEDLLRGGGKSKVPCLRIDQEDGSSQWMYESSDIITFLEHLAKA